MIRVTWTGAAGLRFDTDTETILIDPYHTRVGILKTLLRPICPDLSAIKAAIPEMDRIKAVIVSHTHSDHAMDVPFIADQSSARIIGSASLDALMRASGLSGRTTVCHGGETIELTESAAVTMIRSTHGLVAMGKVPFEGEIQDTITLPMKAAGYRVGTVFAPKLTLNGTVFLHNGSANFVDPEIKGHRCDVLFLCIPGWKKRPGYPQRLMDITRPRTVVLFHHDNFSKPHAPGAKTRPMPLIDLPGMLKCIKDHSPDTETVVAEVGQTITF